MFIDAFLCSLVPLIIRYKEMFGHGHEPDGSQKKCEGDSFGHDAHDVFRNKLLLLQPIRPVLHGQLMWQ